MSYRKGGSAPLPVVESTYKLRTVLIAPNGIAWDASEIDPKYLGDEWFSIRTNLTAEIINSRIDKATFRSNRAVLVWARKVTRMNERAGLHNG